MEMNVSYYDKIISTVDYIKDKVNSTPKSAIILGSGLGSLVDNMDDVVTVDYKNIPYFPQSTVKGHEGRLVFGKINGTEILAMQGRFHYYEGYTMKEVTYPVFVMKFLGIENIVVTNSCGGINRNLKPGDLMIITDFINLMGDNPLMGVNDERLGPRFPDMTEPFKLSFIEKAKVIAHENNIEYKEGVYAGFMGPYYETAAEIRAYGGMGADAIGMSTVPETIAANYLGLNVLGISCITNMATGIQKKKHSHANVVKTAEDASIVFSKWIEKIMEKL
jgi:purine-nucleoside phosphorylase